MFKKHLLRLCGISCGLLALLSLCLFCQGEQEKFSDVQCRFSLEEMDSDFFAIPFPSPLRQNEEGFYDFNIFPNPTNNKFLAMILDMVSTEHPDACLTQLSFFSFDGNIDLQSLPASPKESLEQDSNLWLVNIDKESSEYGQRVPVLYQWWQKSDGYLPGRILSCMPYPGITLQPNSWYAAILWEGIKDEKGKKIKAEEAFNRIISGFFNDDIERLASIKFTPLRDFLKDKSLDLDNVVNATLFKTWHPAESLKIIYEKGKGNFEAQVLTPFYFDEEFPDFFVLKGILNMPQFPKGSPPFDSGGDLVYDESGNLVVQRYEAVPVVITIPRKPMPKNGYPISFFIHGSGGESTQAVDRGKKPAPDRPPQRGTGPAMILAQAGIASICSAMPVNPERFPGATDYTYFNFNNFKSVLANFRQGVIELGLLLKFISNLEFPADILPQSNVAHEVIHFDRENIFCMGQSMGAMYLNLWAPLERDLKALVPSGAGGFWTLMLMETRTMPAKNMINLLFGINNDQLNELHPVVGIGQMAFEPVDPVVTVPHIVKYPFTGFSPKPIYYPAGYIDSYFSPRCISSLVLATGYDLAGEVIWEQQLEDLALIGGRHFDYPVCNNKASNIGELATAVVVQYKQDEVVQDGHYVSFQLDEPKYQYRCFFQSYLDMGEATVFAPADLLSPCP